MLMKNALLKLMVKQMLDIKLQHYKKTGGNLANEEAIGRYIDITGMEIDETDYDEILKQLESSNGLENKSFNRR